MRYNELFAVTDLLSDIRLGRDIKPNHNTKIDLSATENHFKNIIADIDKQKVKSDAKVMVYQLRIEVKE